MRIFCFAIVAFVMLNKLWASAETKWESLMNRIRTEPRVRANPIRRGAPMRTQMMPTNFEPEAVWGVEALDPLQQRAWAQALWQRWYHAAQAPKPLLLLYQPSAERAAMRALNTLARLSRSEECAPWLVLETPQHAPWLAPPVRALSLYLIHRASRFVNAQEWLRLALAAPACRVVLTVPVEEASQLRDLADFEIIEAPQEEPSYRDTVANEILAKHFGALPPVGAPLSALEQILLAAGHAEIALPMSLLARHLRCEQATLCETVQRSRLREFVFWGEEKPERTIAFRGAWLARKLTPLQQPGEYEALDDMIAAVDSRSPYERNFLLQLLLAIRAQKGAEHMLEKYAEVFSPARENAEAGMECQAWNNLHAF
ncbi:MAG: hypothetical protein AAB354_05515 [candidate division KSB1 bacterium]